METNHYLKDVKQTNGCRIWENPKRGFELTIPERPFEIFIKNIPTDLFEIDILPHFERFGPVYQFRLLIDYDSSNRGFAYLIYFYEKSAILCLDLMSFFLIRPGVILDVERSQERSHLLAMNIPGTLPKAEIEHAFLQLFTDLKSVTVRQEVKNTENFNQSCVAILTFADHSSALRAKRWSGVGSINMWNRNVKILWAKNEQVGDLMAVCEQARHVLIHNIPENFDPDNFGQLMSQFVKDHDILSIRPMYNDWLVEFSCSEAAHMIFTRFHGRSLLDQVMFTEWITSERLKTIPTFADFDFELRCLCLANYWDPPIFIYGRIIPSTKTQLVSIIIKNNRKNQFTTFFIEINYENLIDIHSRICELLVLLVIDFKELPKRNLVIKCINNDAFIVGAIADMYDPKMVSTSSVSREPIFLYLEEVYALSKMSYELISSQQLDDIYNEYSLILKEKNFFHQLICGIFSGENFLGCIDPVYRHGKPLKYLIDSRHMILAMCDSDSMSNISFKNFPSLHDIQSCDSGIRLKVERIEMIPIAATQRQEFHFTYRPFIEFNQVDTFSLMNHCQINLMPPSNQENPNGISADFPLNQNAFNLRELHKMLPN